MLNRRQLLQLAAACMLSTLPARVLGSSLDPAMKAIPSSGAQIPAIGMGTARTVATAAEESSWVSFLGPREPTDIVGRQSDPMTDRSVVAEVVVV